MKTYIISYQLNTNGQNYEDLLKYIKGYNYIKIMNSVYAIKSSSSNATKISDDIRKIIDDNDWLLVMESHSNRNGWLNKDIWDFI